MLDYPTYYLTQPLHRALREMPDEIVSIDGELIRTWRELGQSVRKFAGLLGELGVARGDRVGYLGRNGGHFLEYFLGTFWAGAVINPVNLRWAPAEMAYSLNDCDTHVLIVDEHHAHLVPELRRLVPRLRTVLAMGGLAMGGIADGCLDFEARLAQAEPIDEVAASGEDLAAILYTGGTTGRAKGVMLTHRSLMSSALGYAGSSDCAPGPRMLHTAPLFHVGALSGLIVCLLRRSRHIFVPRFDPQLVLEGIARNRVTDIFLVPTMLQAVLDQPSMADHDISSLNKIVYGGAPMPAALLDRAIAILPRLQFVQAYGMTELSPVATLLSPEDHGPEGRRSGRVRSAGRATVTAEIRIADSDDREVATGMSGEIQVRGGGVMAGYWNLSEATAEALRGGWMHTGDVGRMDEQGYVYVIDRLKDMIISGAENIYSVEVEGALASHEAVSLCAVIGRPHPHWGETVHAFIVLRDGAQADPDALIAHCRGLIAAYKCPRSIEFREALPLSAAGKILKAELRAMLAASAAGPDQHPAQ